MGPKITHDMETYTQAKMHIQILKVDKYFQMFKLVQMRTLISEEDCYVAIFKRCSSQFIVYQERREHLAMNILG